MVRLGGSWMVVMALGLGACSPGEPDGTAGLSTTGSTGADTGVITATTLPLPTITDGSGTSSSGSGTTDGELDSTTGEPSTGSTGEPSTTGDTTRGETDTDTGVIYDIEWCRLQFPPSATVAVDEPFTVYVRLYSPGLTDQSTGNDLAPELVVEMGYGLDGSDPSMGIGTPWAWVSATPNVGWDGGAIGEDDNDEHQADLSIGVAGVYDYASRISGDGGVTWVYCDLDDLLTGGYTPDQAGHADVGR